MFYFRVEKNLTDLWLEWANATILTSEPINCDTLAGSGLFPNRICLCGGGYHFPWTCKCHESWHIAGRYLSGYPTVSLRFQKDTSLVSSPGFTLSSLKGITRRHSWLQVDFLCQEHTSLVRNKCKWECDQKPLLTLKDFSGSIAGTTVTQKRSLYSLAQVVLDNRVPLITF